MAGMPKGSEAASEKAGHRRAQGTRDMATLTYGAGSTGLQRAQVASPASTKKATDDMETHDWLAWGSGRRRTRNKRYPRASSNLYWYLPAAAAVSAAFLAMYVSHVTLRNLSVRLKEVRAAGGTQQETLDVPGLQQADASLSTDVSPGKTHEEGKEASSASETETLSTQHHDQSSSTEVSQGGLLGVIMRHIVKVVLLYVYSLTYAVMQSFRFAVLTFKGIRSFVSGMIAVGNAVQMLASVLFTAVSVSLVILGLHLIFFLLSSAFPEGHFHASLHTVFGRGIVVLFRLLQWFPYASLLFSSLLLAVYRNVTRASTRDTVSRGLGVLLAYIASFSISDMLSIPLSDPTWGVPLSTLSYFAALSAFLTVDSLSQWSTRPFMLGLLTLYTLYLVGSPLISAAL